MGLRFLEFFVMQGQVATIAPSVLSSMNLSAIRSCDIPRDRSDPKGKWPATIYFPVLTHLSPSVCLSAIVIAMSQPEGSSCVFESVRRKASVFHVITIDQNQLPKLENSQNLYCRLAAKLEFIFI